MTEDDTFNALKKWTLRDVEAAVVKFAGENRELHTLDPVIELGGEPLVIEFFKKMGWTIEEYRRTIKPGRKQ